MQASAVSGKSLSGQAATDSDGLLQYGRSELEGRVSGSQGADSEITVGRSIRTSYCSRGMLETLTLLFWTDFVLLVILTGRGLADA